MEGKTVRRYLQLDYMKAFAAMMVVFTHSLEYLGHYETALRWGRPFWVDMAVPVFMIISGFTFSQSAEKNELVDVGSWFRKKSMLPKLTRILIPYCLIVLVQMGMFVVFSPRGAKEYLLGILTGGWGPGSYYVPVLIQLLILFPLMYVLSLKNLKGTVWIFFIVHGLFDYVLNMVLDFPMEDSLYRLSILRYLGFLVMGLFLYRKNGS